MMEIYTSYRDNGDIYEIRIGDVEIMDHDFYEEGLYWELRLDCCATCGEEVTKNAYGLGAAIAKGYKMAIKHVELMNFVNLEY